MTAIASAADAAHPVDDESRAAALWTFVHLKKPQFPSAAALDVVRELAPQPGEDVKALAKRLRSALSRRGVSIKHTHALKAASMLAGYKGWHAGGSQAAKKPLALVLPAPWLSRDLDGWDDAVDVISDYFFGVIKGGGLRTFRFEFTSNSVGLQQPLTQHHDAQGRRTPGLRIVWSEEDEDQLRWAVSAIERIRRRFEETEYDCIVDGLAAIQFCMHSPHKDGVPEDPLNTELVVLDTNPGPYSAAEVARGNESQCWRELSVLQQENEGQPDALMQLEDTDWVSPDTGKRYRWQLSTLRATGGAVPMVIVRDLTHAESARLLRRRNMAARAGRYLVPEDSVRSMQVFDSERRDVDINWAAVSAHVLSERVPKQVAENALKVGSATRGGAVSLREFEQLMTAIDADNPQSFIRMPQRKHLALLEDDELLRVLVSRVESVEPLLPRGLEEKHAKKAEELVDLFSTSLRMDARDDDAPINHAIPRGGPYLMHAGAGRELIEGLEALGLVAYAGLTTHARRLSRKNKDGARESFVRASRALLLDIDYARPPKGKTDTFSSLLNKGEEEAK
jgi:hypothetical protein